MALLSTKQQISINDERDLIKQVDEVAQRLGMTRPELYGIAMRKLLKDPAGVVAEILTDRIEAIKEHV